MGTLAARRLDAQRARYGRVAPRASGRARHRKSDAGRPRLRRLDRRRDGDDGAQRRCQARSRRAHGPQATRGRYSRSGHRQLYRLRPCRLPRSEQVRGDLRCRAFDGSARGLGHRPRDVLPHRLEALHVQPDLAASAGKRKSAGADRLGRQGQDRSRLDGEALRGGAAERQARGHRELRALRRPGAAGAARRARLVLHRCAEPLLARPTGEFACT